MRAYVARLAGHGLTGLGFGAGFGHEHVPEALRAAAAEHDFPVFEVPYEVPFIAITEKAFSQLVNEQYAVLRRALSAHERLEKIVLSERGLEGVASGLGGDDRRAGPDLRRARRGARAAGRARRAVGRRRAGAGRGAARAPAGGCAARVRPERRRASRRARWRCRSRAARRGATRRCRRRGWSRPRTRAR